MPNDPTSVTSELRLLEQVHMALASAHKLDDFYAITAGLLVTPDMFGFSRAFILRYDEKTRTFQGRMALGARSLQEHERFRHDQQQEQNALQAQIARTEKESPEPAAVQPFYDLRFRTLWVQLLQGREGGTGLNNSFQHINVSIDDLPVRHLLRRIAESPHAEAYEDSEPEQRKQADPTGLNALLRFPVIGGRLKTRRGLHGLIIADYAFQPAMPEMHQALVRFQWLINHASVSLDNVELVEELTMAAQRMREVDRLKTNFLSIVSHELRTPLTSIVGFIHLLKEGRTGPVNDAQRDMLTRVSNHSLHLQNMVNDILEIAEVESGGMVNVSLQPVDPLGALWNVIPKVDARRSTRDVTIEPKIEGVVEDVITDPVALERIYYHLLDNAIKFIPHAGQVTVEFAVAGHCLQITIADTGIGMSPENLKQIFDHFYQVDYRLERAYGGMGIGLTVVKLLLEATGGTMQISSTPQEGSRFTISYPLARS